MAGKKRQHNPNHNYTVRILADGDQANIMREAARVLPQERVGQLSEFKVEELYGFGGSTDFGGIGYQGGLYIPGWSRGVMGENGYALLTFRLSDFWTGFDDDTINVFAPCEFEAYLDGLGLVDGTTWEYDYGALDGLLISGGEYRDARLKSEEEIIASLEGRPEYEEWAKRPMGKPDSHHMSYYRGQLVRLSA